MKLDPDWWHWAAAIVVFFLGLIFIGWAIING